MGGGIDVEMGGRLLIDKAPNGFIVDILEREDFLLLKPVLHSHSRMNYAKRGRTIFLLTSK
jgi:hypothetical protein